VHLIGWGQIILRLFSRIFEKIAYDNTVWTKIKMRATLEDKENSMNSRSGREG
jgi:hypothetical protein